MNNLDSLHAAFDHYGNQISAILYEPIQGEGGIVPMTYQFMAAIQKLRLEYPGLLLIADEIQSGLGRSGSWTAGEVLFSHLQDYRAPDVVLLGKSITGGMSPMSAVLANSNVMGVFKPGSHGSTYGGNPLAAAASIASLDVLEMECFTKSRANSASFMRNLQELASKYSADIKEVRGKGMFIGIEFNYDPEPLRHRLVQLGYITMTARGNVLRITPPLTISNYELDKFVEILGSLLKNK
jgi:ornithine--oxo-acid transaminase